MRNLLQANLSRLRQDKTFWLCVFATLLCSAGFMVLWCMENAEKGAITDFDSFYFRFATAMGFFYAIFTCLFLSVEYSDGTIRNKLVVGHTRWAVYLSHFFTVFAASLCIAAAWLVGGLAGVPFLGFLTLSFGEIALRFMVIIGFTAVFSAVNTFIGMLSDRRSATVITISVWLILCLVSALFANTLHEPEMTTAAWVTQQDGTQTAIMEPNPYYITGIQREIYEFMVDLLPTGQADSLQTIELNHPVRMLVCSAVITTAATLGGLAVYRKKDLK